MKNLTVAKGESTGRIEVDDCTIVIEDPVPDVNDRDLFADPSEFFNGQASVIVDALQAHLPGGTFDAVLREMLNRKASLLRVPLRD